MAIMQKFDLSQLTEEMKQEIVSCDTAEELKALFAAKDIFVPDSKLEPILKLKDRLNDLDLDALEGLNGAGDCCGHYGQCEDFNVC